MHTDRLWPRMRYSSPCSPGAAEAMNGTPERSPSSADGTAGESLDTAANTSGAASATSHTTSIFAVLMPPLH